MPADSRSVTVAVAGIPVRVMSASALARAVASDRFPVLGGDTTPLAQLEIRAVDAIDERPRALHWELRDGDTLVLRSPAARAALDLERASGMMEVLAEEIAPGGTARRTIEGLLLALTNRRDRHPIHAATLRTNENALLLHGRSGIGKSTLAWEAHRAGIGVLSDDASRIQLSPELRVWGDGTSARLHLLEHVRDAYDDLRGLPTQAMGADNEPKVSVALNGDASMPYARHPRVVLLSRSGAGRVRVERASPDEIYSALSTAAEAEMDLAPRNRERVLRALAAAGGYRLDLTSRASEAVPVLEEMLARTI